MASPVRQAAGAAPTAARDCLMDATPPASARMRAAGGGSPLVLAGDRSGCPSAGCTGEGTAADAELSASPHGAVGAPTLLAPDVTGDTGVIASQAAAPHARMARFHNSYNLAPRSRTFRCVLAKFSISCSPRVHARRVARRSRRRRRTQTPGGTLPGEPRTPMRRGIPATGQCGARRGG